LREVTNAASGRMLQVPPWRLSSTAAKTAGLSKRGQHSQSTAPSEDTSAADRQSDRNA
jgi:hypothetical protein